MDFEFSPKVAELRSQVLEFLEQEILPANPRWHREVAENRYPLDVIERLKARAYMAGLWNLFLPSLAADQPGTRLTNLEYAPLAEIMGRVPWASEVFNCSAPDTGNMELLQLFGTEQQRQAWLDPLLTGEIRSCFAMSEPDVASSDATNIATRIERDGSHYVINGRKWFITGARHPNCRFAIVLGRSPSTVDAGNHAGHSMIIVPLETPGVEIVRDLSIIQNRAPEGHCEILFRDVRVSRENLLGEEGSGFALAQARLGPGRVHQCMRTMGQCELALELMCERALDRVAFGRHLSSFANVQDWIAESRVEIDQARLLTLQAAAKMDRLGNQAARIDVSAIKLVAARLQTRVLDRAMQVFGAMGLGPDTPLAALWTWGRAMRVLDGPDEVHSMVVARAELQQARERRGSTIAYLL